MRWDDLIDEIAIGFVRGLIIGLALAGVAWVIFEVLQ